MSIKVQEVSGKRDLGKFIRFPFQLYREDPFWTPPLLADEYAFFNPNKNKNLVKNPHRLLLARENGKICGRIFGLVNQRANEARGEKFVRWTFFDTVNDINVARALLSNIEEWGKDFGLEYAVGPRGFSDQEPQGEIVEGFSERASIGTLYNRPFLPEFIESVGYHKDVDWVSYKMRIPDEIPASYQALIERNLKNSNLKCVGFSSKAELKPYIIPVFKLLNETYRDIYGFTPMDESEMKALAKKYLPVLDPEFINVIEDKGIPVAFAIAMPDLTAGLRKARGRLFPFGFVHVLRAARRAKVLQLLLVGIKEEYRGRGIFALFAINLQKATARAGMEWIDSHLELEDNRSMRKWMERLNGRVYRRYRAFKKEL